MMLCHNSYLFAFVRLDLNSTINSPTQFLSRDPLIPHLQFHQPPVLHNAFSSGSLSSADVELLTSYVLTYKSSFKIIGNSLPN
jgi:hypothetical protein